MMFSALHSAKYFGHHWLSTNSTFLWRTAALSFWPQQVSQWVNCVTLCENKSESRPLPTLSCIHFHFMIQIERKRGGRWLSRWAERWDQIGHSFILAPEKVVFSKSSIEATLSIWISVLYSPHTRWSNKTVAQRQLCECDTLTEEWSPLFLKQLGANSDNNVHLLS